MKRDAVPPAPQNHSARFKRFPIKLDRHFDSIASRDSSKLPTIVEVIIREHVLTLGLGQAEGFVQLQSEDVLPPYLVTLGDPRADGGVSFYYLGSYHTGIPRKHLIDASMARANVAEFFETGERPENIEWEECTGSSVLRTYPHATSIPALTRRGIFFRRSG